MTFAKRSFDYGLVSDERQGLSEQILPDERYRGPLLGAGLDSYAQLVQHLRDFGYLYANTNPLAEPIDNLDELIAKSKVGQVLSVPAREHPQYAAWQQVSSRAHDLGSLLRAFYTVYSTDVGYELDHVRDPEVRQWWQAKIEKNGARKSVSAAYKKYVYHLMLRAEVFEQFLHKSYPGQRWFSLEGLEGALLLVNHIVMDSIQRQIDNVVIGMAHRGRLNFLAHILQKSYGTIFETFASSSAETSELAVAKNWMTDVKYHQGGQFARDWDYDGSEDINIVMLGNPSHLELVNPVILGAARATQDRGQSSLGVLIHGDAAFTGQGVVQETLNLANLPGYSTEGTIHVIMNNQIGFTTPPEQATSGMRATDLARAYDIPILHASSDSIYSCLQAAKLAAKYRAEFQKDVLVNVVGYRRYGHNESDNPSVTQPLMYQKIEQHPTFLQCLADTLIAEGTLTADEFEQDKQRQFERLLDVRNNVANAPKSAGGDEAKPTLEPEPSGLSSLSATQLSVDAEQLQELNQKLTTLPAGFTPHPVTEKLLRSMQGALTDGKINWGHAEALAWGWLLQQGYNVRLSGQDSERGTFSQRHASLYDYQTGAKYQPLASLESAGKFEAFNSPLSEVGVLGFEYGYSLSSPHTLVMWEAQFGDFVNGAQSVVDEMIVSGYEKWGQASSLVLLLPHGYDGQGPNHSSAHLERFLALATPNNIRVLVPTTAAQYFSALAAHRVSADSQPVPTVIFTTKSLLRHPAASCELSVLTAGKFNSIRTACNGDKADIQRVVMCSGKIFVELLQSERFAANRDTLFICVEELNPLPVAAIRSVLGEYDLADGVEYIWLQEESANRGAWHFILSKSEQLLGSRNIGYIGREATPSAAEGASWAHKAQQRMLIERALGG